MPIIDTIFILIGCIVFLLGIWGGFVKRAFSLCVWAASTYGAFTLYPYIIPYASPYTGQHIISRILVGLTLFVVIFVIASFITKGITDRLRKTPFGIIDRSLGALLMGGIGCLTLATGVFLLEKHVYTTHKPQSVQTSTLWPVLHQIGRSLFSEHRSAPILSLLQRPKASNIPYKEEDQGALNTLIATLQETKAPKR